MGQHIVLRDLVAFGVHHAQVILPAGLGLLGDQAEPVHRLLSVLRDTLTFDVNHFANGRGFM